MQPELVKLYPPYGEAGTLCHRWLAGSNKLSSVTASDPAFPNGVHFTAGIGSCWVMQWMPPPKAKTSRASTSSTARPG